MYLQCIACGYYSFILFSVCGSLHLEVPCGKVKGKHALTKIKKTPEQLNVTIHER